MRMLSRSAILVAAVALMFRAEVPCSGADTEAKRPNIIVILSDDLGYADIGVHGCKDIATPNIDRIAKEGVRFTDAYANGSFCTPTRAALISGRYQHRYGIEDLRGPLPAEANPLPKRLHEAGYKTCMIGKWHLGTEKGFWPVDRGFDEYFGFLGGLNDYIGEGEGYLGINDPILRNREVIKEKRYLTDAFSEEAAAFISRQRGAEKPFFLYLAYNAIHIPLQATDKYKSRYPNITDPTRRICAAMLCAMDDGIGLVLDELDAIGQRDNTLVIFHNDNGGPTTRNGINGSRNTPLRGSKCETFEGGIRVPLLMRWPGVIKPGTTYSLPVISFDITATALAVAGAKADPVDGLDLIPFIQGVKSNAPHDALFWRSRTLNNNFAVRQGNWKYVHSTEGGENPGTNQKPGRDMLFNLANDISEQHDLAAEQPEKLAQLKQLYEKWSTEVDVDAQHLTEGRDQ